MTQELATACYTTQSAEETIDLGRKIGSSLADGSAVICLFGTLAAGKTTLIRGIVDAALAQPSAVHSPTFTFLNIYTNGIQSLYHFDLYRLGSEEDFLSLGFEEYLEKPGICCIEWAEKIPHLIPPEAIEIHLSHTGQGERTIDIIADKYLQGHRI